MSNSSYNRSALVIAAILALVVAWIVVSYLPSRQQMKAYSTEIAALESDLAQLHTLFLSAGRSAALTEDVQSQTTMALMQLMPEDSLEVFVDQIKVELAKYGLNEVTISPAVEAVLASRKVMVGDKKVAEVLLRITLAGRYINIGRAIDHLEQQPYFSAFHRVNLGYDDELNPAIACQIDLSVYLRASEETK